METPMETTKEKTGINPEMVKLLARDRYGLPALVRRFKQMSDDLKGFDYSSLTNVDLKSSIFTSPEEWNQFLIDLQNIDSAITQQRASREADKTKKEIAKAIS